jgi:hypothetical protein
MAMLFNCGVQYYRRYCLGEKRPPGSAIRVGRAVHQAVHRNLKAKCETGSLLTTRDVEDVAQSTITAEWANEETALTTAEVALGADKSRGLATDLAVSLARTHALEVAPKIQPRGVEYLERPFTIACAGYPFDLAGTIDIQEDDTIRDTKTCASAPSDGDVAGSGQLTMYALAAHLDGQPLPVAVAIDALVKRAVPRAVTVQSLRTAADIARLMHRIERVAELLAKEAFAPANPDWWGCSATWCGYAHDCPFWSGRP